MFGKKSCGIRTGRQAGQIQSLGALVDAAAFLVAVNQNLMTLIQPQQASNSDDEEMDLGAPATSVYKTHSGRILDVLEDMKEKAEKQDETENGEGKGYYKKGAK